MIFILCFIIVYYIYYIYIYIQLIILGSFCIIFMPLVLSQSKYKNHMYLYYSPKFTSDEIRAICQKLTQLSKSSVMTGNCSELIPENSRDYPSFQQLHVIIAERLSRRSRLHGIALHFTIQTHAPRVYGQTVHREQRLAGQSQCENGFSGKFDRCSVDWH